MTATAARWPIPDDVSTLTTPDAQFEAKAEVIIAQAVADFQRTVGLTDGTRSAQVLAWTRDLHDIALAEAARVMGGVRDE